MADELVDILDENGKKTGMIKTKGEAHAKGLWHKGVDVWIYNSKGKVLVQKRSRTKDSRPGLWDISAAGHVSAGESYEDAALRELREELGIDAKPGELKQVMVNKAVENPKADFYNKEFDYVYVYKLDILPTKLQKKEVEAVKSMPLSKFESDLRNPETAKRYVPHGEYYFKVIRLLEEALKA